jgi:hypothetical protein
MLYSEYLLLVEALKVHFMCSDGQSRAPSKWQTKLTHICLVKKSSDRKLLPLHKRYHWREHNLKCSSNLQNGAFQNKSSLLFCIPQQSWCSFMAAYYCTVNHSKHTTNKTHHLFLYFVKCLSYEKLYESQVNENCLCYVSYTFVYG